MVQNFNPRKGHDTMFTKSTFDISDSVEAVIELKNAIECGHLEDFPIEQRLNSLYAGLVVISCITKHSRDLFTNDEHALVFDAHNLIKSELVEMGIGS